MPTTTFARRNDGTLRSSSSRANSRPALYIRRERPPRRGSERGAIKNTAAKGAAADCDTLNQPAKNYPLHASCHNGSDTEDGVPGPAIALRLRAEFKGHAAQSQSK